MKLRLLRNTSASGKSLASGQVVAVPQELSEEDARTLIRIGKAAFVPPREAAAEESPGTDGEQTDQEPEGTDHTAAEESPAPRRKGRGRK